MADVSIREAIMLFQYSFTGQGTNLARQVWQRLWQLYRRNEIGLVSPRGSSSIQAQWRANDPGFDLVVNPADIEERRDDQQLGFLAVELVHEAVHAVLHLPRLEEEVAARTMEVQFYRELNTMGVCNEASEPDTEWVRLDADAVPGLKKQDALLKRNQLIDYVLSLDSYRERLTSGFVGRTARQWGGFNNRWPETRGYYINVLAKTYDSRHTGLILDIMESVNSREEWDEMMDKAGSLRLLQVAIDPSNRYLPRIGRLQSRWGVRLVE